MLVCTTWKTDLECHPIGNTYEYTYVPYLHVYSLGLSIEVNASVVHFVRPFIPISSFLPPCSCSSCWCLLYHWCQLKEPAGARFIPFAAAATASRVLTRYASNSLGQFTFGCSCFSYSFLLLLHSFLVFLFSMGSYSYCVARYFARILFGVG